MKRRMEKSALEIACSSIHRFVLVYIGNTGNPFATFCTYEA
jgi:hypothetical protein